MNFIISLNFVHHLHLVWESKREGFWERITQFLDLDCSDGLLKIQKNSVLKDKVLIVRIHTIFISH